MDNIMEIALEYYKNHNWQKAETLFLQIADQENVDTYLKKCRLFQKFSVGNTVCFGAYHGRELTWRVLEERGNMRLLLCDGIAAERPYQDLYIDTSWENASLRKWLNKEFLAEAFSADEQRNILSTRIETPSNEDFYTNGGSRTMDKVFVLSKAETAQYLPAEEDRNLGQWWWLRTPGSSLLTTSIVYNDGSFYSGGVNVNSKTGGVRPAAWILLRG